MKVTIMCNCKTWVFGTFTLLRNGSVTIPSCPHCCIKPQDGPKTLADMISNKFAGTVDYSFVPHSTK